MNYVWIFGKFFDQVILLQNLIFEVVVVSFLCDCKYTPIDSIFTQLDSNAKGK